MKQYSDTLPTPALVVDCQIALANIRCMQAAADQAGCKLRPHIKTHKSPLFTRMQIENGAAGITCAKLGEAEIMADAGADDIFIAYPLVDAVRLERAMHLAKRCKRLILAVDSHESVRRLSATAQKAGIIAEVRLEVDTGAARTGIPMQEAVALCQYIQSMPSLRLTGVYTFKSLILDRKPTTDIAAAAQEEGALMAGLRGALEKAGLTGLELSAGSTPTGMALAKTGCVDEIRPGTYIFNDWMMVCEGAATLAQTAARIIATVVSCPRPNYAVIDGGVKCFSTDAQLNIAPYYYEGWAMVDDSDDLVLDRMSEEHGILRSKKGSTGLHVGQRISLLPVHICTTLNLHNEMLLDWGDRLETVPVAARGKLV